MILMRWYGFLFGLIIVDVVVVILGYFLLIIFRLFLVLLEVSSYFYFFYNVTWTSKNPKIFELYIYIYIYSLGQNEIDPMFFQFEIINPLILIIVPINHYVNS